MKRCCNCHKAIYYQTENDWCGCERVKAWMPDQGETEEDAKEYFTADSEALAIEIAEESYDSDPSDPYKFKEIVCIKGRQGGVETFEVGAEATVNFYATELKGISGEGK